MELKSNYSFLYGILVNIQSLVFVNHLFIFRADSVAWNLHKMLGAPLQCSAFLTKHQVKTIQNWCKIISKLQFSFYLLFCGTQDILHQCNSASASYLFQVDKYYDIRYDTGDKSIQCGRKVDAFKVWLMWKAHGNHGLESMVDNAFDCCR